MKQRWDNILAEIAKIELRNENVILIGDMNKKVGDLIPGNKDKVSIGGKLIVDFLKNGKYVLVNGMKHASGGPFT